MTPLQDAYRRAEKLYKAKGFRSAYVAGAQARIIGRSRSTCPYPDGGNSWRQAYRSAWLHGYASVTADEEE